MGFQSVNEIEAFSFEDCQISKLDKSDNKMIFELESLIVRANNSQNTNYTDSYASTVQAVLENASITAAYREGYKYYSANDELISEQPDENLNEEELKQLLEKISGAYLFFMALKEKTDEKATYVLGIEFASEEAFDTCVTDSYRLEIAFSKAIFRWDRYMNRVQR